jgi:hypothetical protein
VVLIAGLLVPGWCFVSVLGLKGLSPVLAIPAAIGVGISIVTVAAWLGWLSGTGMIGAAVLVTLAAIAAVIARIAWRRPAAPMEKAGRYELGAAALAALAAAIVIRFGPWLGQSADTFYHMAAALTLLKEDRAIPQDVFFGVTMPYPDVTSGTLHLALAWLSLVGGIVPAWVAMSILGAPLLILSFTAFAREVTRSTAAALIAASLYMLVGLYLDFRDAGYPDRIGQALGWLALTFMLRFARSRWLPSRTPHPNPLPEGDGENPWRELVPACLLGFAAGSVYPGMTPLLVLLALATVGVAGAVALLRRNPRSIYPIAIACGVMLLVVLPVLAVRLLAALPMLGVDATLATSAPRLRVTVFHGYPFVDLRTFWFGTKLTASMVATVCLLGRARQQLLRGDAAAALLWGGLLFAPAVAVTPLVTGSTSEIYALARLAFLLSPLWFVPIGWELSALPELAATIRSLRVAPAPRAAVSLLAGLLLVAVMTDVSVKAIHAGPIPIYVGHAGRSISVTLANNLPVLWADRIQALDAAGPGTILAGLETSYELAGLTGHRVVAVPRGHTSYQDEARDAALRRGDVAEALRPSADASALLSVLLRYRVTFVMVDVVRDGRPAWDWIAGQKELTQVAGGEGWELYRFDASQIDRALEIPLTDGVGVFPSRAIAGRAVFVRFTSPGPGVPVELTADGLTSGASYKAQFTPSGQSGVPVTAPLLLPDSARVDRYTLTVSIPGKAPITAGPVAVGHAYEAEYFAGVVFNYARGFARNAGWKSVDNIAYNRAGAASALRTGSVAAHPLAEPPGDYCLSLFVYDAGAGGAYSIDVDLGGNVAGATWSGGPKGVRELEVAASVGTASHQVTYWVPAGARVGAIVDRITLYPAVPGGTCSAVPPT